MIPELLTAFYLEGGGLIERSSVDALADHYPHVNWEPRFTVGAGLEWQLNPRFTLDLGYRYIDSPIRDSPDWVHQLHATVRFKPFAR